MAKRFIDTGLFRKPLVRSMKAPYKALFIYLLCECDHAGVWDVELDVASTRLGLKLDDAKAIAELQGAVVEVAPGKWLVREFVAFQYGTLNPANRVHASVIARLNSLGVNDKIKAPIKDHISPLQGAKDMDKDKDVDYSSGEGTRAEPILTPHVMLPFTSDQFKQVWSEWLAYRKKRRMSYESLASEQRQVNLLKPFDEEFAIGLIQKAIDQKYQGFVFDDTLERYQRRKTGTGAPPAPMDRNAPIESELFKPRRAS